jgi:hypothetical protein
MSPIVIFLLEQVLPWVLRNLPVILKFLMDNYPQAHAFVVTEVNTSAAQQQMKTGQGPGFDWHSGP